MGIKIKQMEVINKNRKAFSRLFLFIVLILSNLGAHAGPMDKLKKLFGNDTDFLTIFYIIGGMFIVCIILYLIGNYFMKKEEAKNAARHAAKPSLHTQMRRAQRRKR
jgi:uncharacterized membrane protein YuzA (DUF378 family)